MDQIKKLKIQPFQVIETKDGLVLRRGNKRILFRSTRSFKHIQILQAESGNEFISLTALVEKFPKSDYSEVFTLMKELISKKFIETFDVAEQESVREENNKDVFFWQLGNSEESFLKKLRSHAIFLVGVNALMQKIKDVLVDYGLKEVQILDFPMLKNNSQYPSKLNGQETYTPFQSWEKYCDDDRTPLFIVGSEFGGPFLMSEINSYCVENDIRFMPVYIRDMVGYIGSVIIPGRTPCMQCLIGRYNSHLMFPELQTLVDKFAFQGQKVMAWHPAMLNVLAETAAFELMRYISELHPNDYGELIEIDLIGRNTKSKKILKLPRCPVCSTTKEINPFEIYAY